MLRRAALVALCIGLGLAWGSSSAQISEGSKLVVYTYESFVAWGPAKFIKTEFEKQHPGIEVEFVATGPSRAMFARLVNETNLGGHPRRSLPRRSQRRPAREEVRALHATQSPKRFLISNSSLKSCCSTPISRSSLRAWLHHARLRQHQAQARRATQDV
jgi:hypothetical protein